MLRYACAWAAACVLGLLQCAPVAAELPVRVFAAASLTDALTAVAALWQAQGHPAPQLVFGGTAVLARQIEAGAPADIFAAADARWMDELGRGARLRAGTRVDVLANELVLVAPRGRAFKVRMRNDFDFARSFTGKLCMGDPDAVPAGTYGRQALQALGWWESLQGRVVGTDDVRAALTFVARGECAAGIVYATDAAASDKVVVLARIPAALHASVVYPFALLKNSAPAAAGFFAFLTGAEAGAIFRRYGFTALRSER